MILADGKNKKQREASALLLVPAETAGSLPWPPGTSGARSREACLEPFSVLDARAKHCDRGHRITDHCEAGKSLRQAASRWPNLLLRPSTPHFQRA